MGNPNVRTKCLQRHEGQPRTQGLYTFAKDPRFEVGRTKSTTAAKKGTSELVKLQSLAS